MQAIAHRGAKGYLPENTLPAFAKALEMGAYGIELDVHLSKDGQIFVFHDEHTERLTGCEGLFSEMSAAEIRDLKVGGFAIPSLQEVMDLLRGRCLLNIELKTKDASKPVIGLIEKYVAKNGWDYNKFLVSSFDWTALQDIRKWNPKIPLGVLTETDLGLASSFAAFIKAETIHPHYHLLTYGNTMELVQKGFGVYAWTVNVPEDIARIKSYGVNGIITDFPDKI